MDNKFKKQEQEFLWGIEEDYIPLHDMVRSFIGYNKLLPTEEEYLLTLEFIDYLMDKYKDKLEYSFGPGDVITDKTPEDLIEWLKEMWYADKYKEIHYGVWFDLKE